MVINVQQGEYEKQSFSEMTSLSSQTLEGPQGTRKCCCVFTYWKVSGAEVSSNYFSYWIWQLFSQEEWVKRRAEPVNINSHINFFSVFWKRGSLSGSYNPQFKCFPVFSVPAHFSLSSFKPTKWMKEQTILCFPTSFIPGSVKGLHNSGQKYMWKKTAISVIMSKEVSWLELCILIMIIETIETKLQNKYNDCS